MIQFQKNGEWITVYTYITAALNKATSNYRLMAIVNIHNGTQSPAKRRTNTLTNMRESIQHPTPQMQRIEKVAWAMMAYL
ncbi:MAG: hypothetical protein ABI144_01140 [Gallionella sp.]